MYGYSEITYLDGTLTVGEDRDDGYTPILAAGREEVHVPTLQLGELLMVLAEKIGLEEAESMIRGAQE